MYIQCTKHTKIHKGRFCVLCVFSYTLRTFCMLVYFCMQLILSMCFVCVRIPCAVLYTKETKTPEVHLCARCVLLCPLCTSCSLVSFCVQCVLLSTLCTCMYLVCFCIPCVISNTNDTKTHKVHFGILTLCVTVYATVHGSTRGYIKMHSKMLPISVPGEFQMSSRCVIDEFKMSCPDDLQMSSRRVPDESRYVLDHYQYV